MDWLSVLGIAVGLAMDALAVSIAAGLKIDRVTGRHVFRAGFHFGLFQFMMPVLGWWAGRTIAPHLAVCNHWIAFGLLTALAGKMLYEAHRSRSGRPQERKDPTRGWSLVALSVATSIDALAVGVSLALLGVVIWAPSVVIGVVTALLSSIGILFGGWLGHRWGRRAETVGALVLLAIGLKILLTRLMG